MKAVIQRVAHARVTIVEEPDGASVVPPRVSGEIGRGMLVFVCVLRGDTAETARALAERIASFRFFPDERGRMNRSALDEGLEALVVSQFTLAADGRKGRRPSFDQAAPPEEARGLYGEFVRALGAAGMSVRTGVFAASMQVDLRNDGPVTFVLEE